jgi:hypothetical protein
MYYPRKVHDGHECCIIAKHHSAATGTEGEAFEPYMQMAFQYQHFKHGKESERKVGQKKKKNNVHVKLESLVGGLHLVHQGKRIGILLIRDAMAGISLVVLQLTMKKT